MSRSSFWGLDRESSRGVWLGESFGVRSRRVPEVEFRKKRRKIGERFCNRIVGDQPLGLTLHSHLDFLGDRRASHFDHFGRFYDALGDLRARILNLDPLGHLEPPWAVALFVCHGMKMTSSAVCPADPMAVPTRLQSRSRRRSSTRSAG